MIEVLMYIMMPAVTIFVVLTVLLKQRQHKERLRREDECAKRITNIKESFRTTLELFSHQRVLRPNHVEPIYNIVNNFFNDQPINEKNTKRLENLANDISMTIAREINLSRNNTDMEWIKKKLLNFALKLPNKSRDYNKVFYNSRVKLLLRALNTSRSNYIQQQWQQQQQSQNLVAA